jgi:hypothetical protein
MKRLAVLLVLLLPGCAVYPAPYPAPAYYAGYHRPPPVVVYPAPAYRYGYRPYYRGGWGRRW